MAVTEIDYWAIKLRIVEILQADTWKASFNILNHDVVAHQIFLTVNCLDITP